MKSSTKVVDKIKAVLKAKDKIRTGIGSIREKRKVVKECRC